MLKNTQITSLNDYQAIALTSIMIKYIERLVKKHIISRLPSTFDSFQFVNWPNRSTMDAISFTLYLSLAYLEEKNIPVQMLFLDFSSALNTIIPQHLVEKLGPLGFSTPLCNWLLDFLTERPHSAVWTELFQCYQPQHRLPSRLCPESSAIHLDDT